MAQYMIEYFMAGSTRPSDCDADFYPTREAAEKAAEVNGPLIDWVFAWRIIECPVDPD